MIKFIYYATVLSLTLAQLTALSKSQGSNIYFFDIMVTLGALINIVYLLGVHKSLKLPPIFYIFLSFILIGLMSLVGHWYKYDTGQLLASFAYGIRFLSYLFFTLSIYNLILIKKLSKEEVISSFIFSGVFIVISGIIQLIVLPDFTKLDPLLGWDPHKNRLASTFFDPNFVGAYLVIILTLLFDRIFIGKKINIGYLLVSMFLLLGLILTFSRSAWLMFAIVVFIYGIFKNRLLLLVSLLIMFLAYFSVPRIQTRISGTTDPADSAQFRYTSWSNTFQIIKDQPVFGVGFDTLRYVQKEYGFTDEDTFLSHAAAGSDSSLLFVWATAGIFGLMVFLGGLFFPFIGSGKFRFTYIVVIIALLAESQFVNSLFYPQIMFLWMTLMFFRYL